MMVVVVMLYQLKFSLVEVVLCSELILFFPQFSDSIFRSANPRELGKEVLDHQGKAGPGAIPAVVLHDQEILLLAGKLRPEKSNQFSFEDFLCRLTDYSAES